MTDVPLPCFATTSPGLEALLAEELRALAVELTDAEPGGVAFDASAAQLATALLALRTAHRVTVRLASFRARGFAELERHAASVGWSGVQQQGQPAHFRVTSKKSRLYHEDAIAERLERALAAAVDGVTFVRAPTDAEALEGDVRAVPGVQRFVVRVFRDQVTISADASGGLLHRRGWRLESGKAPLRETLAAAMLLGAAWDGEVPLLDPFAGSGTIAIEAACQARRLAPGRLRRFAAEQWPCLPARLFAEARATLAAQELPRARVPIVAGDRDHGVVRAALANAARAGVSDDVEIVRATVSELAPDGGTGLLITNPPYGVRVGERHALRNLYAALGSAVRSRRPHWRVAVLSASPMLEAQVGLEFTEVWRTSTGGIPVRLMVTHHHGRHPAGAGITRWSMHGSST